MALKHIFSRRDRAPRKPVRDTPTPRDWADLPTYHPRRDEAV